MQTFLPYRDFRASAEVLDSPRLGKQRVETLQVLRALELPEYGWRNHPAVIMWRGRLPALVSYGLTMAQVWTERGFGDTTAAQMIEFAPEVADLTQEELTADGLVPSWLGREDFHVSHRSRLITKDPDTYRPRFPGTPEGLEYVWPGADPTAPAASPALGRPLWVVRPETEAELEVFTTESVIGLGESTGLPVDAVGLDEAALRNAAGITGRKRPGRGLVALRLLLDRLRPDDEVAVLIDEGRSLLVGVVLDSYRHDRRSAVPHRWPVRWDRTVPRAAVVRPARLQDPRPAFTVDLAAEPVAPAGRTTTDEPVRATDRPSSR
ncbi:MSMEG_6728 family protein [Nakamurella leprariae]|uniref:MSMEG_6728 family protein n=1 Tax=Nakamurella leprariae TaxID=2803911 RepID=A0A939BWI7_9ACTN|nr:MSMEG_6728 family protein [Nakamurella leprariae]MBM9467588.1 MSMEG_6728 family protein [Nakamurella leprariae]